MIQNHMHALKKRPVLIGVLLMGMRNSLACKITVNIDSTELRNFL